MKETEKTKSISKKPKEPKEKSFTVSSVLGGRRVLKT